MMPVAQENRREADREKHRVALSSVVAAVFLTTMKLVVGLLTGSLGILSEAAHSGLDLVAAAITMIAVRISGRPADSDHTYGHGKIENLSALFETLLLLLTCVWIIYEAIQRLFFEPVEVEASFWAFAIMITSIGVDVSRSRALYRVAKKYHSQALEADALHFSTDVWSSSVVIAGLFLVRLSDWLEVSWLGQADAVAAMAVAGIVVYVSVQLGVKTITDLLDAIPPGLRETVQRTAHVPGVAEVKRVRVRRSGPQIFADVTLTVNRETVLEGAHDIAGQAEAAVRNVLPGADVIVHVEPAVPSGEDIITTVRLLASRRGLGAHSIRSGFADDGRSLELHLEVRDDLTLEEAHSLATTFEEELHAELPDVETILTHIEPFADPGEACSGTALDRGEVFQALKSLTQDSELGCHPHDVRVSSVGEKVVLSFHCDIDASLPIVDAHVLTERVEQFLRLRLPNLGRVLIHVEPRRENGEE